MDRLEIKLPEHVHFETELGVRIGDINFAGHLGHDRAVTLLHEVRARFFRHLGYTELNVDGAGIILADLVVVYSAEAYAGDSLRATLTVDDLKEKACAIYYDLRKGPVEVLRARTTLVFYDYQSARTAVIPTAFREALNRDQMRRQS